MTNPSIKYAFYLSDLRHFDYFNNVFVELNRRSVPFCLVVNDTLHLIDHKFSSDYTGRMRQKAESVGYTWYMLSDIIQNAFKFDFSISTYTFRYTLRAKKLSTQEVLLTKCQALLSKIGVSHPTWLTAKLAELNTATLEHPEKIIGRKQIFYPKGMDLNTEKFPDEFLLTHVDHFLSHGYVDKSLIEKKTSKKVSIIGYPRYDNFWELKDADLSDIRSEFGIRSDRKVVTWIPTYGPTPSDIDHNIHVWLPYIKQLTSEFEVIVRPHPKRISGQAQDLIEELQSSGLHVDLNIDRDMSKLYKLSEYVLCDSGGVVFSAVYTLSNLLILNQDAPDFSGYPTPYLVYNVKSQLPSVELPDLMAGRADLMNILNNSSFWEDHGKKVSEIRREYFGDTEHLSGSKSVVDTLISIGEGVS